MWQPPDCVKRCSLAREELPTPISNEPVNITGGDAGAGRHLRSSVHRQWPRNGYTATSDGARQV